MRDHGWLDVSEGGPGRNQLLEISRKGHSLLEGSVPLWKEAQQKTKAILGRRGTRSIHSVADAVWAQIGRE